MPESKTELCVTNEGLIALLLKVSPDECKSPEKREEITRFQRWAVETIAAAMGGTIEKTLEGLAEFGK
jgi:hypothetical protein